MIFPLLYVIIYLIEEVLNITKICKRCRKDKPIGEFSRNKTRRDGLQDYCKVCNGEINKQWLSQHREQYREYQSRWYKENRDRLRIKTADYAKTPTERYRQIKSRAHKRNIGLVISKEEFIEWFNSQKDICHYCSSPLTEYKNGSLTGLTIDRRDNNKPYELGNLALSCMRCNVMKGSWLTEEQMIDATKRYFSH